MPFRVQGSVALVTGANRGIGRALVDALLARGATRVYAGARRPEQLDALAAQSGGRVVPLLLDVTNPEHIRAAAERATDVTLLVNNAGVAGKLGGDLTEPEWMVSIREELEVNTIAPLALSQAFAPVLKANLGGAILNVSSVAGLTAYAMFLSYSASKAALHSLTQSTRVLLAAQGTFVAGVYPGPIETDMSAPLPFAKTPVAEGAHAILDGLEAGHEDILPDVMARQVGEAYFQGPKALEQQVAGLG